MTRHVITLPLAGKNAVAQAALPREEAKPNEEPIMHYVCFVEPSIDRGLEQIPKGPNPRYVNVDGKIPKEIEKSFVEDENFAIKNECNCMELFARPGWEKIMKNKNYKRTHVVLEKQLKKKENE